MGLEPIELAGTGQRMVFRASDAEAVVYESVLPPQQRGIALPDGAQQELRFEVVIGTVAFCIGDTETILTAGGRIRIPRGIACRYWNPGTEASQLVAEVRPALDFAQYAHAQAGRAS
jgi:hypothetical protein